MAASSGDRSASSSADAASVCPGWQYPHWTTLPRYHASRTASTTGPEAPSTVVTAFPVARPANVWHDLVLRPSISTVHAAQYPIPQPYFVPCSPSTSRSTHNSGLAAKRSSTSTSAPFTFSFTRTSWASQRATGNTSAAARTGHGQARLITSRVRGHHRIPVIRLGPLSQTGALTETRAADLGGLSRSEEHTSELQSPCNLVCRLLLEKKKKQKIRERNIIQTQHHM